MSSCIEVEHWFSTTTREAVSYWDRKPVRDTHIQFDVRTRCGVHIALSSRPVPCLMEDYVRPGDSADRRSNEDVEAALEKPFLPIDQARRLVALEKRKVCDFPDILEIVIGDSKNQESVIRRGRFGTELVRVLTPNILSAKEWRSFWIDFPSGMLAVGCAGETEPFMCCDVADQFAVQFMAYYNGEGSHGAIWRFKKRKGISQPSLGVVVVFSFLIDGIAEVDKPFLITICGLNLPQKGDRLKVVSYTQANSGQPVGGSSVVHKLSGSASARTAEVLFSDPVKFELLVCYDPGVGAYEVVPPHKQNRCVLSIQRLNVSVHGASLRLLRSPGSASCVRLPPLQPDGAKNSSSDLLSQEKLSNLIDRLYSKTLPSKDAKGAGVHDTTKNDELHHHTVVIADFVDHLFTRPIEHLKATNSALSKKYEFKGAVFPHLTKEQFADVSARLYTRSLELKANSKQKLWAKYVGEQKSTDKKKNSSTVPRAKSPPAKKVSSSTKSTARPKASSSPTAPPHQVVVTKTITPVAAVNNNTDSIQSSSSSSSSNESEDEEYADDFASVRGVNSGMISPCSAYEDEFESCALSSAGEESRPSTSILAEEVQDGID